MYFADEPEHIAILRELMKRFVSEEMPSEKVRQWDRDHRFPPELCAQLAARGVTR